MRIKNDHICPSPNLPTGSGKFFRLHQRRMRSGAGRSSSIRPNHNPAKNRKSRDGALADLCARGQTAREQTKARSRCRVKHRNRSSGKEIGRSSRSRSLNPKLSREPAGAKTVGLNPLLSRTLKQIHRFCYVRPVVFMHWTSLVHDETGLKRFLFRTLSLEPVVIKQPHCYRANNALPW